MEKLNKIYSGKAKDIYETDDPSFAIMEHRDDLTALNGEKRGSFNEKGIINHEITGLIFSFLESKGIKTHFVRDLNSRESLVKKVSIIPLEVIVRNVAAGSFSKKYGVAEGAPLKCTVLEFSLKNDALGDPMLSESHAVALGIASQKELSEIGEAACRINGALTELFSSIGLKLVDFKVEFGRDDEGKLLLADEITPDSCRLWDLESGEKLDKDRFRRSLGGVEEAYREVWRRLKE
ncbi:MAG: phosphoribosylaminoimidazolesuccinocarboxamide synthase [Clostridiales bacterium]|jgi:phosphoribosylaminoimidazole-succinocarboxamide synthase|nr:phosphoribosylaminoimidazolesuccinocarboxamide synthase [Clostridiales bacterium]